MSESPIFIIFFYSFVNIKKEKNIIFINAAVLFKFFNHKKRGENSPLFMQPAQQKNRAGKNIELYFQIVLFPGEMVSPEKIIKN